MRLLPFARTFAASASGLALACSFAAPAWAQPDQADPPEQLEGEVETESGQDADEGERDGTIFVTGSRIRRLPTLDSTVPITSVGAQELTDTGEISLGDALNQLPALRATFSQANSTRFIGTAGLNLLDLRGLGSARTLVLVNGRRHVTSSPGAFSVDVNTIPVDLLERVDVVTGGNSAIYGSDAVSGVVNFILRRDFDGFRLRGQNGISDKGDRHSFFIAGVLGRNFMDNRANVAVAVEYGRADPLFFRQRPGTTGALTGFPGFAQVDVTLREPPEGDGIADTRFIPADEPGGAITFNIISTGGTVLTSCPPPTASPFRIRHRAAVCTGRSGPTGIPLSHNYMFLSDGRLVRNVPSQDLREFGGPTLGGLGASGVEDAMLLPGLERIAANLLFNVEIASAFQPFLEAKFVRVNATQSSTQPTFIASTLSPLFFLDNPFLTEQARQTIRVITGQPDTSTRSPFIFFRFNNDIGTRTEVHERDTLRLVGGVRGDLASTGNWNYEVAFNYGRTETYYETGGNVHIARFNAAANAARDRNGSIVCRVNIDTNPNNDMPGCVPINLFGFGAPSQQAIDYVLHTSSRTQWAEQINAVAFVSGDTSSFLTLPGGPIGLAFGAEYRREDAYSDYDDVTQSGATFLNAIAEFAPPAQEVREAFGEIRIPILRDMPFFQELTLEGAARYSDYNTSGGVWAYNAGAIWAPVRDLRIRGGYARSVRGPNLSEAFGTPSQTFANGLVDPCSQTAINQNPNRARNCAEHGVPTTMVVDGRVLPWVNAPASGVLGLNQGNPNLEPERGTSWTVGAVIQPRFLPGFSLTIDYYNIEIEQAISGLSGQAIINRCYDDPVSTNNPFCAAVFRRRSSDPFADFTFEGQADRNVGGSAGIVTLSRLGPGFLNQPFNFQSLKTSGIDFDAAYRRSFGSTVLDVRAIVSWLENREFFVFINDPARSERIHGTLGDPEWAASLSVGLDFGIVDVDYDVRFIDRMTIGAWETQFSHQGRPPQNADAFPVTHYPRVFYHDVQVGVEPVEGFRFYLGVDNVFDRQPPFGLTGTGPGSGTYPVTGRFFYSGVRLDF